MGIYRGRSWVEANSFEYCICHEYNLEQASLHANPFFVLKKRRVSFVRSFFPIDLIPREVDGDH